MLVFSGNYAQTVRGMLSFYVVLSLLLGDLCLQELYFGKKVTLLECEVIIAINSAALGF